ncbi:MAG: N-acetylmuramoyl-L-alanine amidase [Bacteroidota bacterium]
MKTFIKIALLSAAVFLSASFSTKTKPPFGIKTVVIDAGHGGKDPGCHGSEFKEKDIALAIALKLGAYIEKYCKDVKVVYTRKTDVFVELNERANIANKNKADLFICIHCNSACKRDKKTKKDICNDEVYGAETYVMGTNKLDANLSVAQRENAAILYEDDYKKKYEGFDPDSDEGFVFDNILQSVTINNSLSFAARVQKNFKEKAGRADKGVKQAGFLVLWKTSMPSVLIETGFLTNEHEHDYLGDEKGQDNMAAAIFRAFRQYKDDLEGRQVKYDDEIENMKPYVMAPKVKKDSTKTVESDKGNPEIKKNEPKKDSVTVKKEEPKKDTLSVVFKVQFLSSDKQIPLTDEKFKGIENVSEYKMFAQYKYCAGEFKEPSAATKLQDVLRSKGYKDAFVVAFKDGKRISYNDAIKMINE